jgi:ABC-type sugar transport system ATPase subunit
MNFLPGRVQSVAEGNAVLTIDADSTATVKLPLAGVNAGDAVTLAMRPETTEIIAMGSPAPLGATVLHAKVESVERLGNITFVYLDAGTSDLITVQVMSHTPLESGQRVQAVVRPQNTHVFNAGGASIAVAAGT